MSDNARDNSENNLPLWDEALERASEDEIVVNLASTAYRQLSQPVVSTFYSLRGGVGRSTALSRVATILSSQGLRTLCVDMDLEAPGLHNLFKVEDKLIDGQGIVPLLVQADTQEVISSNSIEQSLIDVNDDGQLLLLPAGKIGAEYAKDLSRIYPQDWAIEEYNPLREIFSVIRDPKFAGGIDVILIDARTGISSISAPLVLEEADLSVILFYPHPQARLGSELITRAILASKSTRETVDGQRFTPEPRFVASPLPAIEESFLAYSERAVDWVAAWLSPARKSDGSKAFDNIEDIVECVPYSEVTASSSDTSGIAINPAYENIASWIAGLVRSDSEFTQKPTGTTTPQDILESISFGTGVADETDPLDADRIFVRTAVVRKALSDQTWLILGRKGTGKTALYRQLSRSGIPVATPPGQKYSNWTLTADLYESIDAIGHKHKTPWRVAWCLLVLLRLAQDRRFGPQISRALTRYPDTSDIISASSVVAWMDSALTLGALEALEALESANSLLSDEENSPLLLFDGLDTGFGSTAPERSRRREAVEGLLEFVYTGAQDLDSMSFKVMLREDIWKSSRVTNKSHMMSRSVRLAWDSQSDFLSIAISQALESRAFKDALRAQLGHEGDIVDTKVEFWNSEYIYSAWRLLVGDRMAGGKTAYTTNWVWSRLADANSDHAPRHLLNLMRYARDTELQLGERPEAARSLIRPRSLIEALDLVSDGALDSLISDEFTELEPLVIRLRSIGITPFAISDVRAHVDGELYTLAQEVGLIDLGGADERARVPELYRKALSMGRKGQA